MVLWNITVTNIGSDTVANATVYLFIEGGIQPPEQADYTKKTINGVATFDVPAAFYKVGVIAPNYKSAYEPHNPPEEWLGVWTCWGAGGAPYDYDFAVTPVIADVTLALWQKGLIIASAILSMCAAVFVVKRRK